MFKLYISTWRNTFNYSGRARRLEYWAFAIVPVIVCGILGLLVALNSEAIKEFLNLDPETMKGVSKDSIAIYVNLLSLVFVLPYLDKSGWRFLLIFIPVIGTLYLSIVSYFFKGTVGSNKYGADPKKQFN